MKLSSGRITIPVERDGVLTGEISFDPQDVRFAESFYSMMEGLTERERAYAQSEGTAMGERLRLLGEICGWITEQVEQVFGEGSSGVLFGGHSSMELFRQFFEGVEPYITKARTKKTAKYREGGGTMA